MEGECGRELWRVVLYYLELVTYGLGFRFAPPVGLWARVRLQKKFFFSRKARKTQNGRFAWFFLNAKDAKEVAKGTRTLRFFLMERGFDGLAKAKRRFLRILIALLYLD